MNELDLNGLDRMIAWFSPRAGAKRAHYRRAMAYYEAANPSRLRKGRTAPGTGNMAVQRAGRNLREQARYFEQNHDLARGVLADLVAKTVGPCGITCEPQPRSRDGTIHDDLAAQILELYKAWSKYPEVTWSHDWPSAQRLIARSWFRDGEVFAQEIFGNVAGLEHGSSVPYSIEMLEADLIPFEYSTPPTIVQGVELNAWGRALAYHVLQQPPGDIFQGFAIVPTNLKRIPAERMLSIKSIDRIRQIRGVSVFASVLGRLDDLKDYEESERIAAKVAASMAAFIKKGAPEDYDAPTDGNQRDLKFRPGMIFDDLKPGEEIGTIDTTRPNANLQSYRQGQLRALASGTTSSYSSIAKDYSGTYSAQRQELVESYANYGILAAEFAARFVRPTFERFVRVAIASGAIKIPRNVLPESVDDAIYLAPQMPWIDPESEANAAVVLETAGYISAPEIIRRRGGNPRDVLLQEQRWRKQASDAGLTFTPTQLSVPNPEKAAIRKGQA
jgi:lambda family phage portal protein